MVQVYKMRQTDKINLFFFCPQMWQRKGVQPLQREGKYNLFTLLLQREGK